MKQVVKGLGWLWRASSGSLGLVLFLWDTQKVSQLLRLLSILTERLSAKMTSVSRITLHSLTHWLFSQFHAHVCVKPDMHRRKRISPSIHLVQFNKFAAGQRLFIYMLRDIAIRSTLICIRCRERKKKSLRSFFVSKK